MTDPIKISALTADTAPTSDDLILTVNDPAGTPANRKVTLGNLLKEGMAFPQTGVDLRLWNITGDNYERSYMKWDSNVLKLGVEAGGTGTVRSLALVGAVDIEGNLTGLTPVLSYGADQTLTDAQVKGQLVLVTATATITLPAVVVGSVVTIYSTTAAAVHVDPNINDRIILDGAAGGDGKKITSASAAGDLVTLIGDSAAGWVVIGRSGSWTMEA